MEKKITDSGAKAYQREDTEWRAKPYSDWHRTLDKSLLMTDVDFIEWRFIDGELTAVGVMEVTRVDMGKEVNQAYLDNIIHRFEVRDFQAKAARHVAEKLGTKVYIILFREDCSEFWTYNLTDKRGWAHYNPQQFEAALKRLGQNQKQDNAHK
jgi:hypothetical protein